MPYRAWQWIGFNYVLSATSKCGINLGSLHRQLWGGVRFSPGAWATLQFYRSYLWEVSPALRTRHSLMQSCVLIKYLMYTWSRISLDAAGISKGAINLSLSPGITFPEAMQQMLLLPPLRFPSSGSEKRFNMESMTKSIKSLLLGNGLQTFSLISVVN